jgi:hypothetical protein
MFINENSKLLLVIQLEEGIILFRVIPLLRVFHDILQ